MTTYIISGLGVIISALTLFRLYRLDRNNATLEAVKALKQDILEIKEENRKMGDVIRNHGERLAVLEDRLNRQH